MYADDSRIIPTERKSGGHTVFFSFFVQQWDERDRFPPTTRLRLCTALLLSLILSHKLNIHPLSLAMNIKLSAASTLFLDIRLHRSDEKKNRHTKVGYVQQNATWMSTTKYMRASLSGVLIRARGLKSRPKVTFDQIMCDSGKVLCVAATPRPALTDTSRHSVCSRLCLVGPCEDWSIGLESVSPQGLCKGGCSLRRIQREVSISPTPTNARKDLGTLVDRHSLQLFLLWWSILIFRTGRSFRDL